MTVIELNGCRPEPIGSYLKALGILRLVAAQRDGAASAAWRSNHFELHTAYDHDDLVTFFMDDYQPTPILAPWNGRSGFRTDVSRESEKILAHFEAGSEPRLAPVRATIAAGRRVRAAASAAGWDTTMQKQSWVQMCRNEFPDEAVAWLDAIAVLTDDGPVFPPLLGGSGGVLGSMDLSTNFLFRLSEVLGLSDGRTAPDRAQSEAWLRAALLDEGDPPLRRAPIGQFDPGAAGGVNSSAFGAAETVINPWDYVLMLEGALVWAGGATRRMGVRATGTAAMPFTVQPTAAGQTTAADGETPRGEVWAPLWSRPASAGEIARLIGEGRSSWRRGQARSGLDFVRAVATMGTDRGIDAFVRHSVVERLGLSMIAIPVDRVSARTSADSDAVGLLGQMDNWVNRLRSRPNLSQGVVASLRRLDRAQYEVTREPGDPARLLNVLLRLAELEEQVARSAGARELARAPVQDLSAEVWAPRCDDGTDEFAIARALASGFVPRRPTSAAGASQSAGTLRELLCPVRPSRTGRLEWTGIAAIVPGLGQRPVTDVVASALARRCVDIAQGQRAHRRDDASHMAPAWPCRLAAPVAAVAKFAEARLDDGRVEAILRGLLRLDWTRSLQVLPQETVTSVAPAVRLLLPFFHGRRIPYGEEVDLTPDPSWPRQLVAGHVEDVISHALLRLQIARLQPAPVSARAMAAGIDPNHLAAALFCPISDTSAVALLRATAPSVEPAFATIQEAR